MFLQGEVLKYILKIGPHGSACVQRLDLGGNYNQTPFSSSLLFLAPSF